MALEKHTVLLLDDDKFLLDMYSMKFQQQGYSVQAFVSTDDALAALRHKVINLGADQCVIKASAVPSEVVNIVEKAISGKKKA